MLVVARPARVLPEESRRRRRHCAALRMNGRRAEDRGSSRGAERARHCTRRRSGIRSCHRGCFGADGDCRHRGSRIGRHRRQGGRSISRYRRRRCRRVGRQRGRGGRGICGYGRRRIGRHRRRGRHRNGIRRNGRGGIRRNSREWRRRRQRRPRSGGRRGSGRSGGCRPGGRHGGGSRREACRFSHCGERSLRRSWFRRARRHRRMCGARMGRNQHRYGSLGRLYRGNRRVGPWRCRGGPAAQTRYVAAAAQNRQSDQH